MSEPVTPQVVTPLGGLSAEGIAVVREIGPVGMIMLRVKNGTEGIESAFKSVTGADLPARRAITRHDGRAVAWMSPDEYLLILPRAEVGAALATLSAALEGRHHLAVDVSDARAVFRVEGARADEVVQKLCPVDLQTLAPDEVRRTRAAQVAAALWREGEGITVVTFRSVARYAFDILANAAQAKPAPTLS
jgi:sarcosine oxidase, subunit gamma